MKKRVSYVLLEDMQKYIKGINVDDYEPCYDSKLTDPSIIEYVRRYYDDNLPVDLTAWQRVNQPDENLRYANQMWEQVAFVSSTLCQLWHPGYEYWENNPVMVISTHTSKSVRLPVYQINLVGYEMEIVLRNNFHNWKVSINCPHDSLQDFNYMNLIKPARVIPSHLCEGFPKDKVYGSYRQNHSKFTVEIDSTYNLYTFMYLLKNYLDTRDYC